MFQEDGSEIFKHRLWPSFDSVAAALNFIQVSNFQGWWRVLKEPGGTNAIMDLELKEENGQIIDVYSVYSFCCGMKSRLNWLMQEQLKEFGPEMEDSFTRIFQSLHELWSVNLRVQPGHPSEFSPELTFEAKQQSPEWTTTKLLYRAAVQNCNASRDCLRGKSNVCTCSVDVST